MLVVDKYADIILYYQFVGGRISVGVCFDVIERS